MEKKIATALLSCNLCPRQCGVNRSVGQLGYCQAGSQLKIFRHGAHFGEEPPISGTRGSGTIFFSHCTMRCIYCQNHPWSRSGKGVEISIEQLSSIMEQIAAQGCHNWNLVSPTPWLPQIQEAVFKLKHLGISLPFVYNSSGFESTTTLAAYSELADIALVDLRYAVSQSAAEGSDTPGYVEYARHALKWFWERLGCLQLDQHGVAKRGVICRILVLPGRSHEAIESLEWIAKTLGNTVHISLMAQYTPVFQAKHTKGWQERLSSAEYESVTDAMADLGFDNGWIQALTCETGDGLLGETMLEGAGFAGDAADLPDY